MLQGPGIFSTWDGGNISGAAPKYRSRCASPSYVDLLSGPVFRKLPVNCGRCKHCRWVKRETRANDVAMELASSDWALFLTLTIAPDPARALDLLDSQLSIKLLQDFQKRCRIHKDRGVQGFAGKDCKGWRYLQCGEYGSLRGRAHYHVVIFGKGDAPDWPIGDRVYIPEWEYGHVCVSADVTRGVGYYLSKYMAKDDDGGRNVHSASSNPSLGASYVFERAVQLALSGSPVMSHGWQVQVRDYAKDRSAILKGAKRRDYIRAFAAVQGKPILSYLASAPDITHWAIKAADMYERRRAASLRPMDDFMAEFRSDLSRNERWRDLEFVSKEAKRWEASYYEPGVLRPVGWNAALLAKYLEPG